MEISYGILSGIVSMFSWGVADFFAAKYSRKIGSALTLFWSQVFGFSIFSIYFLLKFQGFDIASTLEFLPIIFLSGLLWAVAALSFYKGFTKGIISLVSPLGGSYAWLIVLLSVVFFNESPQINQIIGIILIIGGIPLLSVNLKELLEHKKLISFSGAKEGLIAMFGWGFCFFLLIPATRAIGWFLPVFIFRLFLILFLVGYIILSRRTFKIDFRETPVFTTLATLSLIGFLYYIALFAYSFGVRSEYASLVAPISASFPLVTIVLARFFLKEKLAFNQALGIAGVILGLVLVSV